MFEQLFANRLKSARTMAGLSLDELAGLISHRVTKQALQKYEKGVMKPDSTTIIALSKVLKIKSDFFFRELSIPVSEFEFRKKSKLSVKDEKSIKETARNYLERYLELEFLLGIETKSENPLKDLLIKCPEDAEKAALELRKQWQLGFDAIPNLIETLEDNDIKVCQVNASESFDGLASSKENYSIIVINNNIKDLPRKRFTVAHELGHLFLNIQVSIPLEKEKICHRFAGAFLLPQGVLIREFGAKRSNFSLFELTALKSEFGISLQAILRRALDLEIISDSKYKSVCIEFAKRGWKNSEPGEYLGEEEPKRFMNLLLRALTESIITISKAAALANMSIEKMSSEANPIL